MSSTVDDTVEIDSYYRPAYFTTLHPPPPSADIYSHSVNICETGLPWKVLRVLESAASLRDSIGHSTKHTVPSL